MVLGSANETQDNRLSLDGDSIASCRLRLELPGDWGELQVVVFEACLLFDGACLVFAAERSTFRARQAMARLGSPSSLGNNTLKPFLPMSTTSVHVNDARERD